MVKRVRYKVAKPFSSTAKVRLDETEHVMSGWEWLAGGIVVGIVVGCLAGFLVGDALARQQEPARHKAQIKQLNAVIAELNRQLIAAQEESASNRQLWMHVANEAAGAAQILLDNLAAITSAIGDTPQCQELVRWAASRTRYRVN